LAQVLRTLPAIHDERLLVGHATFDDAGVYRISPELALVQTIDFFPPVVDDPFQYGQIAATNSISDVYAMGGEPLTALSMICFPSNELDLSILAEILKGGAAKALEASCTIVGGHSMRDKEIKFGLAVTGTIHPGKVTANDGAKVGDRLFLTKPLGIGPFSVAYRKGVASADLTARAVAQMSTLNKAGAEAMRALGIPTAVHAATDITGFGLLGHARNIALASKVTMTFRLAALPFIEGTREIAANKMSTGAYSANQNLLADQVQLPSNMDEASHRLVFDAETSGGLLICVAPERGDDLLRELKSRGVVDSVEVGVVEPPGEKLLRIV
jgi:selenide,water dikinase